MTQIHTKAFAGIEKTLKELAIHNTSLKNSPTNHNIFEATRSMPNIEHVYIFYSRIEGIPENAFNGTHDNLTQIILYGNKITKVGNNAFSQLKSLQSLQLDSNEINHINENAFNFLNSSDNYLDLFLNNCLLDNSSFEKKAFNNLKRPTIE